MIDITIVFFAMTNLNQLLYIYIIHSLIYLRLCQYKNKVSVLHVSIWKHSVLNCIDLVGCVLVENRVNKRLTVEEANRGVILIQEGHLCWHVARELALVKMQFPSHVNDIMKDILFRESQVKVDYIKPHV